MGVLKTLLAAALLLAAAPAGAHEYKTGGGLKIDHPWAAPSPGPKATLGTAYMKITNKGARDDVLIAVKSDIAETVELREGSAGGGIAIAAGATVKLKPGGPHLLFKGLKEPFVEFDYLPMTLVFKHAGEMPILAMIEAP